ncbi:MAG: hypothetical protein JF614_11570 [Acidobacteria bacterium]|nr:hypothetical protein [Acidobacteriota bacterium]
MDHLHLYSRQDSPTSERYTAVAPPPPAPAYRCMAPFLDGFVRRSELARLIATLQASGLSGAPVGLMGAEGFGKTALAQAACWDQRVRAAFPDGILWTSLTEGLDAHGRLEKLREIVRGRTRVEPPAFDTLAAAGAHLGALLAGCRALLVIDGASAADRTFFASLPAGVAVLITTCDGACLPAGAQRIEVGPLATPEAVALLRAGLPRACEGSFGALAKRLANWPLLLGIVNRQIRERAGKSRPALDGALQEVVRALEVVGLAARFDRRDPQARRAAVWRAVAVALRSVPSQDRDRLIDLAAFPPEEDVPLTVVRSLWGLGPTEARALAKRLRDLALVSLDPWAGTLRLHTLVHGFLLRRRHAAGRGIEPLG